MPESGGRLVIGATEAHGRDDIAVDAAGIERLKTNAAKAAPRLGGAREARTLGGGAPARPTGSPDPRDRRRRPLLALGHYRNGVLHAPAMAEAMAALILGQGPVAGAPQIEAFSSNRFRTEQLG
ncbi:MAG: FAD-dependent oxidoreductase [Parvularculaceae bacterium]